MSDNLLSRRDMLIRCGAGFGMIGLASVLAAETPPAVSPSAPSANPLALKPPHHAPKAKHIIHLYMNGGPSQVDTFDYKPVLEKYAGKPLPDGKKFINSGGRKIGFLTPSFRPFRPGGQSGLLISDFFPNIRKHADKLAVIRSCHTDSHAHGSALVAMNTGKTFIGRPSLGTCLEWPFGNRSASS